MRSTSFLAFFLLAFLSMLQLGSAESTPIDDLVGRDTGLDIAPISGESYQLTATGGSGLSNSKSEKLVIAADWAAGVAETENAATQDPGATVVVVASIARMAVTER
ncbi:hypothetical protein FRC12_003018 [Ceratobasidium sp. 428]|nr:hypothetical protein FRC12_003018 [Ceratobasidium sp. 428]